ncbi:MAG: NADH:ubiquinone reductase (Na(+)-transporting) subunit C [Alistipes sp.]|nr:NADH:ubiquinone reductase (Na(+)-transporting) subunit C [Alistipes sp.]
MKVNTNSNVYIIIYSVVMVVIVAVLLAFAALALKPRQDANELNEKKTQIVKALGYDAEKVSYDEVVAEAALLNADGAVVNGDVAKVFAALQDVKSSCEAGEFPIFKATDGSVVVPLYGAGLWGPIWGYIALEPDMNTVKGIVLDHKGETPGLGAEIATPKHQAMYVGKTVFDGEELKGIILKKGGADANNPHEVDAITGGTKTSDGVSAMIKDCLKSYEPYFKASKATANEVSNELNTENNGK